MRGLDPLTRLAVALALCAPDTAAVQGPGAAWTVTEAGPLFAADPDTRDHLGWSVSAFGDTLVAGAPNDDHAGGVDAGSAYVFVRDGAGGWDQVAQLVASDASDGDLFGSSVAVFGDTVVVGAPRESALGNLAGAAYVFERHQGGANAWGQVGKLLGNDVAPGDQFGNAVAAHGGTLVVGAWRGSAAYVFEDEDGAWLQRARLIGGDGDPKDHFGNSVSVWGDTVVVGAPFANYEGAAYVFSRDLGGPGAYGEEARIDQPWPSTTGWSPKFGTAVSVHEDRIAVGAPYVIYFSGSAHLYERIAGVWEKVKTFNSLSQFNGDAFGQSIAVRDNVVVVGAPFTTADAAYVFERNQVCLASCNSPFPDPWGELALLRPMGASLYDAFGHSVSITGREIFVGAMSTDGAPIVRGARGMAHDPNTGTLYGVNERELITIDPATGQATLVGPLGFDDVFGLAFDPVTGTLWGSDTALGRLLVIDPATGAATTVGAGSIGTGVDGLAFHRSKGQLFGTRRVGFVDTLIRIDTTTGQATVVGPTGSQPVRGLTYDPLTGELLGSEPFQGTNRFSRIDPDTAAKTLVGTIGFTTDGLGFDSVGGTLFGSDGSNGQFLFTIDPPTGVGTFLGPFTPGIDQGAVVEHRLAYTEAYCTAGVSASGCAAALTALGYASATAPSGFDLRATSVEGDKDGLFFFGTSGRQANPWGNGSSYQCVVPPVVRGGLLSGVGSAGACDNTFAQDLNALWSSQPPKNPGAGATVQAQLWYRDPLNTSNQSTSLSHALEFPVGP